MPHMSRISGALLLLSGGYVTYYWVSLLSGNVESGPVRFMQTLQRGAQDLVLRLGERIWLAVGVALFVAAAIVLVGRRMRDGRLAEDDDLAELEEPQEEAWDESTTRSGSER